MLCPTVIFHTEVRQQDEEVDQFVASLETQNVKNGPIVIYKQLQKYAKKDAILQKNHSTHSEGMVNKVIECKRQTVFFLQTSTFNY